MSSNQTTFLRLPEVAKITGLSVPTIYAKAANGTFPKPIKISARASAWVGAEVESWAQDRISASRSAA